MFFGQRTHRERKPRLTPAKRNRKQIKGIQEQQQNVPTVKENMHTEKSEKERNKTTENIKRKRKAISSLMRGVCPSIMCLSVSVSS